MTRTIAITVQNDDGLDSIIDPRFGRARGFLFVDADTREIVEELENRFADFDHGAGTGAAALMGEKGVEAVVSGRFGPKAEQALVFLRVEMWSAPEGLTAAQILDRFSAGTLQRHDAVGQQGGGGGGGRGQGGGGGRGRGQGGGGGGGRGQGGGGGRGRGQGGGGGGGRGQGGGGGRRR